MILNYRLIIYMLGWIALMMAGSMLPSLGVAIYYEDNALNGFTVSIIISLIISIIFILQGLSKRKDSFRRRDGLAAVGVSWMFVGLMGTLPYIMSGAANDFWTALFESFSGFSTTGATNFSDVEQLPPSILLWRALSNWLGGMGIIVLMLAVLPFFGVGGMQLFKNEVPGVKIDKLRPRVAETAKFLWGFYLTLTLILFILFMFGGIEIFDSICLTLSTMSTGGFSNRNDSIGYFSSFYIEVVAVIFMFICSINFDLHYQAVKGNWRAFLKNTEFKFFCFVIIAATFLTCLPLVINGVYASFSESFYHSLFHVVSISTTTAFGTTNWESWPSFSQAVLVVLFFIGGCSGSTSGGIKCIRWILMVKGAHRALRQSIHPRAIINIRLCGRVIPDDVLSSVWSFFILYLLVLAAGTLALSAMGLDVLSSFTSVCSSLANIGPGLGLFGPANTYAELPGMAKGVLSLCMFLGRLEFFSILILLLPEFWKD